MAGARLVGALVALTPFMVAVLRKKRGKDLSQAFLTSGVACLAPLLLFSYGQIVLGQWNAYQVAQNRYWGVIPDFTAIFKSALLHLAFRERPPDGLHHSLLAFGMARS